MHWPDPAALLLRLLLFLLSCCTVNTKYLHLYCAVQETRELALRGVDGPGMHIFDVLPNSFPNAEGDTLHLPACADGAKDWRPAAARELAHRQRTRLSS